MKATSPALNKPKRSEEEAWWDYDHRINTIRLGGLRTYLRDLDGVPREFDIALRYALERLHNEQAKLIKARAK